MIAIDAGYHRGLAQPGYITVHPCRATRPLASNLNFVRGRTVANMVVAPVDDDGVLCLFHGPGDLACGFDGAEPGMLAEISQVGC